jgi:hypothetical protein
MKAFPRLKVQTGKEKETKAAWKKERRAFL